MSEGDPEGEAISTLLRALEPLEHEQRVRVLRSVLQKLDLQMSQADATSMPYGMSSWRSVSDHLRLRGQAP